MSEEGPDRRRAWVVARGLFLVGLLVDAHGAELIAVKFLAVEPRALLLEQDRPGRAELDQQPDHEIEHGVKEQHHQR